VISAQLEAFMKNQDLHYDTLLQVTEAVSQSKEPEEVFQLTVDTLKNALGAKGCCLFLIDEQTQELGLAASTGLSREYLNKGPVKHMGALKNSLENGPLTIHNVAEDPRIQYPEQAVAEGIVSILSVPVKMHGRVEGIIRIYSAETWDFALKDVNLLQAVAQIAGMAIDLGRLYKGFDTSIEILKPNHS
jgi:GAF domain-containing protein